MNAPPFCDRNLAHVKGTSEINTTPLQEKLLAVKVGIILCMPILLHWNDLPLVKVMLAQVEHLLKNTLAKHRLHCLSILKSCFVLTMELSIRLFQKIWQMLKISFKPILRSFYRYAGCIQETCAK